MRGPQTYGDWVAQIQRLKGGGLGHLVVVATLIGTLVFAYLGFRLFPPGRFPRIVLALPGLVMGAVTFLGVSLLLWPLKRPKESSEESSEEDEQ